MRDRFCFLFCLIVNLNILKVDNYESLWDTRFTNLLKEVFDYTKLFIFDGNGVFGGI